MLFSFWKGSVRDYASKHGGLNEEKVRIYCTQILDGVAYLHSNMVIHRDIKGTFILSNNNHLHQCCCLPYRQSLPLITNQNNQQASFMDIITFHT